MTAVLLLHGGVPTTSISGGWLCAAPGTLACQRERHEATGDQRHCGTEAQKCWSLPGFPFKDRARVLRPEERSRESLHAHEGS